jgi:hypothetical protein
MAPNQGHVVAAAVSCHSQQIIHALEPRFTRQIVGDVGDANRRNRIHHDVPVVHPVTPTDFYVGAGPDANAAPDSPATNSLANSFGEEHMEPDPIANRSVAANGDPGSLQHNAKLAEGKILSKGEVGEVATRDGERALW